MKNYIVILISTIVLSKTGFSQDKKDSIPAPSEEALTALQVMPSIHEVVKKNELSVDLIPMIKWASMSEGLFDVKGTIQYKRQLKSHLFLRFGVTGVQERVDRKFTNIQVHPAGLYDAVTYTGTKYKPQLHINTGLEFRWGKRRIKQFVGADIGYVHKERVYTDYVAFVPRYSNYDPNNYTAVQYNGLDSTALYNNANTHITGSFSQKSNGIAIAPFYGVQFDFSRRFFFSMQLGLPLQFNWVRNENTSGFPGPGPFYRNQRMFNIDFGDAGGGILNNFSLGFRF